MRCDAQLVATTRTQSRPAMRRPRAGMRSAALPVLGCITQSAAYTMRGDHDTRKYEQEQWVDAGPGRTRHESARNCTALHCTALATDFPFVCFPHRPSVPQPPPHSAWRRLCDDRQRQRQRPPPLRPQQRCTRPRMRDEQQQPQPQPRPPQPSATRRPPRPCPRTAASVCSRR
jgi:hypothetical protein